MLQEDVIDANGEVVMELGKLVDEADAHRIAQAEDVEEVLIRSVLNCESDRGVCANCYGRNMATGQLVNIGEAVGVVAAQSIGEPGTQLTLRTFHIGGTAGRIAENSQILHRRVGTVNFVNVDTVENPDLGHYGAGTQRRNRTARRAEPRSFTHRRPLWGPAEGRRWPRRRIRFSAL